MFLGLTVIDDRRCNDSPSIKVVEIVFPVTENKIEVPKVNEINKANCSGCIRRRRQRLRSQKYLVKKLFEMIVQLYN